MGIGRISDFSRCQPGLLQTETSPPNGSFDLVLTRTLSRLNGQLHTLSPQVHREGFGIHFGIISHDTRLLFAASVAFALFITNAPKSSRLHGTPAAGLPVRCGVGIDGLHGLGEISIALIARWADTEQREHFEHDFQKSPEFM